MQSLDWLVDWCSHDLSNSDDPNTFHHVLRQAVITKFVVFGIGSQWQDEPKPLQIV
jgi:hypothetical protein